MARINLSLNKKAIFFSIASILIIILFIASSQLKSNSLEQESEIEVTRVRVKILNSMIKDMEEVYFDKMLYVAAKNSFIGLSHFYYDKGFSTNYMKNINFAMQDVIDDSILNINNNQHNLSKLGYIDSNYTLNGLRHNLSSVFNRVNVDIKELNFILNTTSITQINPWTIQVKATIIYDISDKNDYARWKGITTRTVFVPVYGMYAFDMAGGKGRITSEWKTDNGTITEPSLLNKLNNNGQLGKGICKSGYCQEQ